MAEIKKVQWPVWALMFAVILLAPLALVSVHGQGEDTADTVSVTSSESTTAEYRVPGRGGLVIVPSGSSITSLTYYTAEKVGGTRVPLNSSAGVATTQTVAAGKAYDMPSEVYGCRVLYFKGNAAGSIFVTNRN